jgi:hypothetical protein
MERQDEIEKISSALRTNDIIAEVIKLSADVEFKLDLYLGIQFGGPLRIDDFLDLIAPAMTLATKINVLRKMKFHKAMKAHANIIDSAERIRRIRNKLAHAHRLTDEDIKKIQSDRKLVDFILGYPRTFDKERKMLDNSFTHLWRSWEVRWEKWLPRAALAAKAN